AVLLMTLGVARGSPIAIIGAIVLGAVQAAVCLDEIRSRYIEACGRSRQRLTKRVARFFWRRFPAPRWKAATPNVVELLFWRGRFRWRNSLRIAIVQDMTTRIHPELHTDGNIAEFEEFL